VSAASSIASLWDDTRYAIRALVARKAFSLAAILTLTLGIGASAAIFSVVYGVMLKPLPFAEAERLVSINHSSPPLNLASMNHGPATYFVARDHQRVFEDIGAWETNQVSVIGRGEPERLEALSVSYSTLPVLRVQPLRGRLFSQDDDAAGSPLRVVLTWGYWQRRFGGADDAIGQSLLIDGVAAQIIGVLPSSFKFLREQPAVLLPLQLDRADADHIEFDFQALGRLKPGVTIARANIDMARWITLLPRMFGRLELRPLIRPLSSDVIGDVGRVLWILLGAVGIVLFIACANVANLFLIHAEGRQHQFALRAALGASHGRIARAMLSESLLLALGGGLLGLVLAQASIGLLRSIAPARLPRIDEISLSPAVLLFTLAVSVLSGALFGLVGVLRFGRLNITVLKDGGRSAGDGPGRHRTRNILAVAQVALALMLMIVSGLMTRTVLAMRNVQPGFRQPEHVQTFRLAVPEGVIRDEAQVALTFQRIAERLAQVPGVSSVGLSSSITMDGEDNANPFDVEDAPPLGTQLPPLRRFKSIGPAYFETMGNPLVAGRSFTWAEIHQRQPVIIISEALAREYWQDPARAIGKRVRAYGAERWREVIGVSGDERDDGLNHPATPIVYWPYLNDSYERRTMAFAVRSSRTGTAGFMRELQHAVWSTNSNLPLAGVQTLAEIQSLSMAQTSFTMVMLAIAASVALLLGVVGLYGVIAYVAAQRTREIGIRMALGARTANVRALFLRHGLRLTVTGIVLGVAASLALTRVLSALLFGVGPTDPLTYAAVSLALAAVALLATDIPARRATRVDPGIALRAD
jgi:putative ABC transport system permease protein